MQTHFIRRPPRHGQTRPVGSPVESLVLQAVPEDFLAPADEIQRRVNQLALKEGEAPPIRRFLDNLLAKLARENFIYEVHPQRVKKMLEGIQ